MISPKPAAGAGCALLAIMLAAPLHAQERPLAFRGAHIIPITGEPIDNGVLIVHNGRISAVGPAASVRIPANAETRDVAGKVI